MTQEPKIESIDTFGYGNNNAKAPAASKFGVGATDLAGITDATQARTNLSNRQSIPPVSIDKLTTKR